MSVSQDNASKKSREARRTRRFAVEAGILEVAWLDKTGKMRTTRTQALNISESGMAIQLPEEVMPLLVRFESEKFNVKGAGTVRYCRRLGSKYIVGIEFTEGLRWVAPKEDVPESIPFCDPESVR